MTSSYASPLSRSQRIVAGMAHLFAVIPIWGIVADFWLWHTRREEHPELRFQILQAFFVQAILLLLTTVFVMAQHYFQLLHVLNEDLSNTLCTANSFIYWTLIIGLALLVLWAVWRLRWQGHFEYPVLGQALRRELERADADEHEQQAK